MDLDSSQQDDYDEVILGDLFPVDNERKSGISGVRLQVLVHKTNSVDTLHG